MKHDGFSGTNLSKNLCKSVLAVGSAFSKITRLALVCWMNTVTVPWVTPLFRTIDLSA
jgi:hypothetical protein